VVPFGITILATMPSTEKRKNTKHAFFAVCAVLEIRGLFSPVQAKLC